MEAEAGNEANIAWVPLSRGLWPSLPPWGEKSLKGQVRNVVGLGASPWVQPEVRLEKEEIFRGHEVREDFPE